MSWLAIGFLVTCYDSFVLKYNVSPGTPFECTFVKQLHLSLTASFLGALMGGSFLIFYVNEKYRDKPYGFTMLAVVISFMVVVPIITIILAIIVATQQTGKSITDPETIFFYAFLYIQFI